MKILYKSSQKLKSIDNFTTLRIGSCNQSRSANLTEIFPTLLRVLLAQPPLQPLQLHRRLPLRLRPDFWDFGQIIANLLFLTNPYHARSRRHSTPHASDFVPSSCMNFLTKFLNNPNIFFDVYLKNHLYFN